MGYAPDLTHGACNKTEQNLVSFAASKTLKQPLRVNIPARSIVKQNYNTFVDADGNADGERYKDLELSMAGRVQKHREQTGCVPVSQQRVRSMVKKPRADQFNDKHPAEAEPNADEWLEKYVRSFHSDKEGLEPDERGPSPTGDREEEEESGSTTKRGDK